MAHRDCLLLCALEILFTYLLTWLFVLVCSVVAMHLWREGNDRRETARCEPRDDSGRPGPHDARLQRMQYGEWPGNVRSRESAHDDTRRRQQVLHVQRGFATAARSAPQVAGFAVFSCA